MSHRHLRTPIKWGQGATRLTTAARHPAQKATVAYMGFLTSRAVFNSSESKRIDDEKQGGEMMGTLLKADTSFSEQLPQAPLTSACTSCRITVEAWYSRTSLPYEITFPSNKRKLPTTNLLKAILFILKGEKLISCIKYYHTFDVKPSVSLNKKIRCHSKEITDLLRYWTL